MGVSCHVSQRLVPLWQQAYHEFMSEEHCSKKPENLINASLVGFLYNGHFFNSLHDWTRVLRYRCNSSRLSCNKVTEAGKNWISSLGQQHLISSSISKRSRGCETKFYLSDIGRLVAPDPSGRKLDGWYHRSISLRHGNVQHSKLPASKSKRRYNTVEMNHHCCM